MLDQVQLQLFIGPGVPIPASREVIDAVKSVTVESGAGGSQSGFELTFRLNNRSPLHTLFLLTGGSSIPIFRVVIAVTVQGSTAVLIDGVMTHHEVSGDGGPTSTLTVKGKDLTAVMDLVPLDGLPFPAMPPSVRVLIALAKYAALGVIPAVLPSVLPDIPIPTESIPRQQGTDYEYVKMLANEAGYVFHINPGPKIGTSTAYWGPEVRLGTPQPALNASLDGPHSNVTSLSFSFDKERKELPIVFLHEKNTKVTIPVPIPDITPLNPPLGLIPPLPPKITPLRDTAKKSPIAAAMAGLSYAATHSDSVFGTGALDVARYGRVLEPRKLVGVRGAGEAFDGLHYVTSVRSTIERGSFTQSFSLARNALVSTVQSVPV